MPAAYHYDLTKRIHWRYNGFHRHAEIQSSRGGQIVTKLIRILDLIDRTNAGLAALVSWACLAMVLLQATSVLLRYVFNISLISFQEAVVYCHALIFLLAAAALLQRNQHVRVDVIYGMVGERTRRFIDIAGLGIFILPMVLTVLVTSWPYVVRAWDSLEGSRQAGGLPAIYLLKTAIVVFAITVALQAVSVLARLVCGLPAGGWRSRSGPPTESQSHHL